MPKLRDVGKQTANQRRNKVKTKRGIGDINDYMQSYKLKRGKETRRRV